MAARPGAPPAPRELDAVPMLDVLHGAAPGPRTTAAVNDVLDAVGTPDAPSSYDLGDGCALLVVPGHKQLVSEARRWVVSAGSGVHGISGREDEVMVAVSEAAANALEHSHRGMGPAAFVVLVRVDGGGLRVLVGDDGSWDPSAPEAHRGRGTALMAALSDGFARYSDAHGTVVALSFGPSERLLRD